MQEWTCLDALAVGLMAENDLIKGRKTLVWLTIIFPLQIYDGIKTGVTNH